MILSNNKAQENTRALEGSITYLSDISRNFFGGIKKGNTYMGLLTGEINYKPQNFLKDGQFVLRIMNTHGKGLSENYIGDIQIVSNIENGNYTFLSALYYKQKISKFQFSLGIQDLNEEFCVSEYASYLTNSSFGIHSSYPLNFGVPIYPKTAPGFLFFINFSDNFILRNCIFDGDAGSLDDDKHNIRWNITKKEGLLYMSELEYRNENYNLTSLKLGIFYHSGTFVSPSDTNIIKNYKYGFHLIFDKEIFNNNSKTAGFFGQIAYFPSKINYNPLYIGSGLIFKGFLNNRNDDIFSLGLAYAQLFDKSYECDFEINYEFILNNNISLKPSFHYVVKPGGNLGLNNSLSGFLRLLITIGN